MRRMMTCAFLAVTACVTLSSSTLFAGPKRQTIDRGPGVNVNDLHLVFKPQPNSNNKPLFWKAGGAGDTNGNGIRDPGEGKEATTVSGGESTWAQNEIGTLTNGDKADIDFDNGSQEIDGENSYWTADGIKKEAPSVLGLTELSLIRAGPGNTFAANVTFRNPGLTNITYNNIVLARDNVLANYNVNNFTTVTGTLVSAPSSISLAPGGQQTVSLGTVAPGKYELAMADVFQDATPGSIYHWATADRAEDSVPTLSEWGIIVLLVVLTGGLILMARRRRQQMA